MIINVGLPLRVMEFIAFLGDDKDSWGQITALLNRGQWDRVVLVQDKKAEGFPAPDNAQLITVDSTKPILDLRQEMQDKLKKAIGGEFEVALSLASGTGKEHMALVSALLNMPVGIKLVVFTKDGVHFLS